MKEAAERRESRAAERVGEVGGWCGERVWRRWREGEVAGWSGRVATVIRRREEKEVTEVGGDGDAGGGGGSKGHSGKETEDMASAAASVAARRREVGRGKASEGCDDDAKEVRWGGWSRERRVGASGWLACLGLTAAVVLVLAAGAGGVGGEMRGRGGGREEAAEG